MIVLNRILHSAGDAEVAERLHRLEHQGRLETLLLAPEDVARRRLRRTTDAGTDCAVALGRHDRLYDGAVLHLDEDRAIVVRVGTERWLRLVPRDAPAALALGYLAGNLHWKVRFEDDVLLVAQLGSADDYLNRVSELMARGAVTVTHV